MPIGTSWSAWPWISRTGAWIAIGRVEHAHRLAALPEGAMGDLRIAAGRIGELDAAQLEQRRFVFGE